MLKIFLIFFISHFSWAANEKQEFLLDIEGCYEALQIQGDFVTPATNTDSEIVSVDKNFSYSNVDGSDIPSLNILIAIENQGTEYYRLYQVMMDNVKVNKTSKGYDVFFFNKVVDKVTSLEQDIRQQSFFEIDGDEIFVNTITYRGLNNSYRQTAILRKKSCRN